MDTETLILIAIVAIVAMSAGGAAGAAAANYGSSSPQGSGGSPSSRNASSGSSRSSSPGSNGSSAPGASTDVSGSDVDILARTMYGEARGAGQACMVAVANVVLNRYYAGFTGGTIAGICQAPWQFSCWNSSDQNLPVIQNVTQSNSIFAYCLQIAQQACGGSLGDTTGGALYYHDTSIGTPASWGAVVETTQIGSLIFYRLGGVA